MDLNNIKEIQKNEFEGFVQVNHVYKRFKQPSKKNCSTL